MINPSTSSDKQCLINYHQLLQQPPSKSMSIDTSIKEEHHANLQISTHVLQTNFVTEVSQPHPLLVQPTSKQNNPKIRIRQCKPSKVQGHEYSQKSSLFPKKPLRSLLSVQQSTEETEDQYEMEGNPGPGQYNIDLPHKTSFRSRKEQISKIFYSTSKRFENFSKSPPRAQQNNTSTNISSFSEGKHNKGFFLSKLPKFYNLPKDNTPPPGHYNTRQTLEYQLIRGLLKSSSTNSFINTSTRAINSSKQSPGPGSYDSCILQNIPSQSNSVFKSRLPRNPQGHNLQSSSSSLLHHNLKVTDNETSIIHVKEDPILESDYFQSPPFLSSSQRFPFIPKQQKKQTFQEFQKFPKRMPANKVPFNSSSQRQLRFKEGDGVGVGLYSIFQKQNRQII